MDSNDEATIQARMRGWAIFTPDWDYLRQFPAHELGSLCALSVGLHPGFADPSWVFNVAIPHFNGSDLDDCFQSGLDDAHVGSYRAALLDVFIKRVFVAVASLFPRGDLNPCEGEAPAAERTVVKVAEFADFADRRGWALPSEFPRSRRAGATAQSAPATIIEPEGVTATVIIDKFRLSPADSWKEKLRKAPSGRYVWLAGTWTRPGVSGRGAALFSPVRIGLALIAKGERNRAAVQAVIERQFPSWLDQWEAADAAAPNTGVSPCPTDGLRAPQNVAGSGTEKGTGQGGSHASYFIASPST